MWRGITELGGCYSTLLYTKHRILNAFRKVYDYVEVDIVYDGPFQSRVLLHVCNKSSEVMGVDSGVSLELLESRQSEEYLRHFIMDLAMRLAAYQIQDSWAKE